MAPVEFAETCKSLLTMMMAECSREFERLPILLHADILRNVLYSGVWSKYTAVTHERLKGTANPDDTARQVAATEPDDTP
jgi:hypothetical protein